MYSFTSISHYFIKQKLNTYLETILKVILLFALILFPDAKPNLYSKSLLWQNAAQ